MLLGSCISIIIIQRLYKPIEIVIFESLFFIVDVYWTHILVTVDMTHVV